MKVAFYSTTKYDKAAFEDVLSQANNAEETVEISFLSHHLDHQSASLAAEHEAVCIFVNDLCDDNVLQIFAEIKIKFIALRCAGFDNVDISKAQALGIKVVRVPSYSPHSVAEFTVGMLMTVIRKYHKAYNRVREGNFLLDDLVGFDLQGKTVGIVGTGKIGLIVSRILSKGFGCNVIAYDLHPNHSAAEEHGFRYVENLKDLLEKSDILSLHCPLSRGNRHLINDNTISQMKNGVILINTSRGALIDSKALIHGLKSGRIGAVGLDVYEGESEFFFKDSSATIINDDVLSRLCTFYNVFISGHQAFLTKEALDAIATTTLSNLKDLKSHGTCSNIVSA